MKGSSHDSRDASRRVDRNAGSASGSKATYYLSLGDSLAKGYQSIGGPWSPSAIQPSSLPLNVQRACEWTWMCLGGDIHPNNAGYGVIARAFALQLAP
jgi:hypothetical protein